MAKLIARLKRDDQLDEEIDISSNKIWPSVIVYGDRIFRKSLLEPSSEGENLVAIYCWWRPTSARRAVYVVPV